MGIDIKPKFVSFDMNGTLIQYRQDETIRKVLGDRLPVGHTPEASARRGAVKDLD